MSLAEGVQARVTYKAYSTGVITSNTQPTSSVDPAATGGQILRRVSSSLKLEKATYKSAEIRADRQMVDYRHGAKKITGALSGEFSPLTYKDLFEAAFRSTWVAAVTASQTDFTSVAADSTTSKFTFAGGNPVTKGFRIGMIIRFGSLSDTNNNSKNFLITGFGGSNNRDVSVYPAPETMTADTSFTVASIGKTLTVPSSGFVSRKFAFEHYFADIDLAKLFTECRVGGFNIKLPASGNATVEFPVTGRDMELTTGGSAPFFSSPTAETTTGLFQAVNGLLRVGGTTVGVVTALDITYAMTMTADAVVGQNFAPEIFLGSSDVSGQITAFLQDGTLINDFKNESEIDILAYLTTTSADASPASAIYLPRVKFTGDDNPMQGEGGQTITLPFQALKYVGSSAGVETTTIQLADTEAT